MSGAIWWIFIAEGLAAVIASRWLRIKWPPKPCLICERPGTYRVPRRDLQLRPMPGLCCEHRKAVLLAARKRLETKTPRRTWRRHHPKESR